MTDREALPGGEQAGPGAASVSAPEPAADGDGELMLAFQQGDLSAFDLLVGHYRQRALNIATRFVQDADEAEDLAQEAFVRIYRARHTYRATARFSTWFYTIITRLCLNESRRRRKVGPAPAEEFEDTPDSAPSPEQSALRRELAAKVQAAVAALPENQRLAVILHRYEGLSYQETAESMGVSVSAVESLLHRAKKGLHKRLGSYVTGA